MNEKQSVASGSVLKEIQTIVRHWNEIDKSKLIGLEPGYVGLSLAVLLPVL